MRDNKSKWQFETYISYHIWHFSFTRKCYICFINFIHISFFWFQSFSSPACMWRLILWKEADDLLSIKQNPLLKPKTKLYHSSVFPSCFGWARKSRAQWNIYNKTPYSRHLFHNNIYKSRCQTLNTLLVHDNGHMIVHVLVNVSQKKRRNDTHPPKRNADQVHILVARRVRRLPGGNHDLARRFVVADARDGPQFREQRGAGQGDCSPNQLCIFHPEFHRHSSSNVFHGVGDEFVNEDVIIHGITDAAADDSDGQSQCRNGRDEVLLHTSATRPPDGETFPFYSRRGR